MACINVDVDLGNTVKRCTKEKKKKRSENHPFSTGASENVGAKRTGLVNLPDVVVMIRELIVIKAKLIHKVSSHLLDLIV